MPLGKYKYSGEWLMPGQWLFILQRVKWYFSVEMDEQRQKISAVCRKIIFIIFNIRDVNIHWQTVDHLATILFTASQKIALVSCCRSLNLTVYITPSGESS